MMKQIFNLFAVAALVSLAACGKDEFPTPPASTVPDFTYTLDNDALAPALATFTNTSIVPERAGDVTFYWNFGDGASAEGDNVTHVYQEPGAFEVRLVAVTSGSLEIKETVKTIIVKDPNASGTPVFFTDGSGVFAGLLNTQAPIFEALPIGGLSDSYGMAIDTVRSQLYISDYDAGIIYRANLDGTGLVEFRTGLEGPSGLTLDYTNSRLYWDTGSGIQRGDISSSDPTQKEDFVTGQPNDPEGLSIDAANGVLYWINYNGGVWKKNLDGTGETELIPDVEGGSILVAAGRIYFDQYIGTNDIHLKSANLDGTGVAVLATGITRVVYALNYDPAGQKIYWGDRNIGAIKRANPDGSDVETWYSAQGSSPRGLVFGKQL